MIYSFYEIATVLVECLLLHIFFNAWFGLGNQKRLKIIVCMTLFFLLQSLISLLPLNPILRAVISYFLVFAIASLLYKTTFSSALYSALLYIALVILSEYLSLVLLNSLGLDTGKLMAAGNERTTYLALAKSVHFVVVLVAASVLRKNRAALTPGQILPLLPCLVVSIYICIVFYKIIPDHEDYLASLLVIALIGLLYINGIIVINTQSIKTVVFENEEQRLARQHYEMQEQYYRNVLKDREETRALWHDLKKHIIAMEALIGAGDSQNAKAEYDRFHQAFDELGNIVDVDNLTLNAIFHHNIKQAKTHNISVCLDAHVSPELSISAVDLSVIIGNTFDNAIEECAALAESNPKISVTIIQQNQMLFYEITNPCMQIPHKKAGKHRGYGLANVKRCVEKYNGSIENGVADGQYRVSIRLNCS